jgi:hypothetical protein
MVSYYTFLRIFEYFSEYFFTTGKKKFANFFCRNFFSYFFKLSEASAKKILRREFQVASEQKANCRGFWRTKKWGFRDKIDI